MKDTAGVASHHRAMTNGIGISRFLRIGLFLCALVGACSAAAGGAPRYILYVHGRAIEDGGRRPSTRFGIYEYDKILDTFRARGFRVLSTQRHKDADVYAAADETVKQIQRLIRSGVPPSHITVIGASKGSVITMLASTKLQNPEVRYVIMGNCNETVFARHATRLSGRVLSIYEESDEFGHTCEAFFKRHGALTAHDEVHLRLGINHAFLYSPLPAWVEPATAWARRATLRER